MVSIATFRQMALSFPQTSEQAHFEKTAFRVKKKIFATLSIPRKEVVLKFSIIDQSLFCCIDQLMIFPVKGAWGRKGWTVINLQKIKKALLANALATAYNEVASNK